ncbi:hypothetical protein ABZX77_45765 [Streptomyces sp. NPDC004237]|uniref:hypothetical protein n=1 Tax=Streptomyces sp. NPDC004237 TaxID=3154455 RepID=UPI0033A0414C
MSGENDTSLQQEPPRRLPVTGTLLADAQDRVGEFRGEWGGRWFLRPVSGGTAWQVDPEDVRPATAEQRLRFGTARANARSRGDVL